MDSDELYLQYQADLRRLEDEEEDYIREKRRFEIKKEEFHASCAENRRQLEELFSAWGDCQETGVLTADFGEAVEMRGRELQSREEALREKLNQIRNKRRDREFRYEEEKRNLEQEAEI